MLSLRVTLTHKCNYRCIYCHMEGEESSGAELSAKHIRTLALAAKELGIGKFKLTGGEPLIKEDILEVVSSISEVKPLDLSLTTNGYMLSELAKDLKRAGLKRVNISLPTLDSSTYRSITGVDGLERVLEGIEEAIKVGLSPVKLNVVVLKGFNESEIWEIVDYARRRSLIIQVIELEPIGKGRGVFRRLHADLDDFERRLKAEAVTVLYRRWTNNRPQYFLKNGAVVELVKPIHSGEFCKHCTKLRVTASGHLKPCVMRNDNLIPIMEALERGDVRAVKRAIITANSLREPYFLKNDVWDGI